MALTGKEREVLRDALASAFLSKEDLEIFTSFKLNVPLHHAIKEESLSYMVFKLIEWCESKGLTDELIIKALDSYPDNYKIKNDLPGILKSLPPPPPPSTDKYEEAKNLVLEHLAKKNFRMVSFERIRKNIDPDYTDEFLMEMIRRNRTTFRRAILKGDKPGVAKND